MRVTYEKKYTSFIYTINIAISYNVYKINIILVRGEDKNSIDEKSILDMIFLNFLERNNKKRMEEIILEIVLDTIHLVSTVWSNTS